MLKQSAFSGIYLKSVMVFMMLTAFFAASCQEKSDKLSTELVGNQKGKPVMTFEETKFDFGKITSGEKVSHVFEFTNTGDGDLVISSATASCGCTVPEWPKEPVKPGKSGKIMVTFNSQGKEGMETKTIDVRANTEPPLNTLTIVAEVMKSEKE